MINNMLNVSNSKIYVSRLVKRMEYCSYMYRQVQMIFLNEENNLPVFGKLFHLLEQFQNIKIDELIYFEESRGLLIDWNIGQINVNFLDTKPSDVLLDVLKEEKNLYRDARNACKSAYEDGDMSLYGFLQKEILPQILESRRHRVRQYNDVMGEYEIVLSFIFYTAHLNHDEDSFEFIERRNYLSNNPPVNNFGALLEINIIKQYIKNSINKEELKY